MSDQEVKAMITKAAKADKADDALKFSQAACNAANAMCALASSKTIKPSE
jgi:tartrate dehydratase beta subunit/fumarate hydratase class I family protein